MGKISGWPKSSLGLFHNILQENPNKLFGQSSTTLPFSLLKEVFHADFTHVLPSKASQPNSLHGAFSEVHQAEREPWFFLWSCTDVRVTEPLSGGNFLILTT